MLLEGLPLSRRFTSSSSVPVDLTQSAGILWLTILSPVPFKLNSITFRDCILFYN